MKNRLIRIYPSAAKGEEENKVLFAFWNYYFTLFGKEVGLVLIKP